MSSTAPRPARIELEENTDGWHWKLVGANGRQIAKSCQGYTEKWRAKRAAKEMAGVKRIEIVNDAGVHEVLRA